MNTASPTPISALVLPLMLLLMNENAIIRLILALVYIIAV